MYALQVDISEKHIVFSSLYLCLSFRSFAVHQSGLSMDVFGIWVTPTSVVVCKMRSFALTQCGILRMEPCKKIGDLSGYGKSAFHIEREGMKAAARKKEKSSEVVLLLWIMTIKGEWPMTDALQIANGNKWDVADFLSFYNKSNVSQVRLQWFVRLF